MSALAPNKNAPADRTGANLRATTPQGASAEPVSRQHTTTAALSRGVKGYWEWVKALRDDKTLLETHKPKGKGEGKDSHYDLRYTALVIASFGENGRKCHPSAATVAGLVGCSERHVKRQRKELVQLGWFTKVGTAGRVDDLDISLPEVSPCTCPEDCEAGSRLCPCSFCWESWETWRHDAEAVQATMQGRGPQFHPYQKIAAPGTLLAGSGARSWAVLSGHLRCPDVRVYRDIG
jgi:Helix-turn-helix domain